MRQGTNQLEKEMMQWEAREQRFAKLFSPSILQSRAFKKEKLRHLQQLSSKYRWANSPDERLTGKLLRQERKSLEKELYPNKLKRNFFRLVHSVEKLARVLAARSPEKSNLKQVSKEIGRAGFYGLEEQLKQKLLQGTDSFVLSIPHKVNGTESLDYQLSFGKGDDGKHYYKGHRVSLPGSDNSPAFFMDASMKRLPEDQAFNLLSGRAVLVDSPKGKEWMTLDFNDKDAKENLPVKRMPENQVSLEQELEKLPLKEIRLSMLKEGILASLRNGEKIQVTDIQHGKEQLCQLAFNGKKLDLYNAQGCKVGPDGKSTKQGSAIKRKPVKQLPKIEVTPASKVIRLRP